MPVARVLLVAGYGGHAGLAFSIGYYLARRGVELDVLVPRGYEWVERKMSTLGRIVKATLPRRPAEPLYRGLHRWLRAFSESLSICREGYSTVFASGSNFSIPPAILCRVRGSRILAVEDVARFTERSRAVSVLYKLGATVFLHWEEQVKLYKRGVVAGPVYEPAVYEPIDEGYILVTTVTFGHRELFNAVSELNPGRVVLQTGDVDPEPYRRRHPEWIVFQYTDDIHKWIAGASAVITHYPGTTALTARLSYGKPVVMVYSPRHKLAAPREDAWILSGKLNAVYLERPDAERLEEALKEASRMPVPAYPNGGEYIAEYIARLVD